MKIRAAITKNALVFIACFSQQSTARIESYQNEELTLAIEQLRRRRPDVPWLIPVRLDDCVVPDLEIGATRSLSSIQRADLFGNTRAPELERLLATVKRLLGEDATAAARPAPAQTAQVRQDPYGEIIAESRLRARREKVERVMAVRRQGDRTQIAILEDGTLVEHHADEGAHQSCVGNVYLGKVQSVLPSMEAAFIDIGDGRNAVLFAGDIDFDGGAKRIESAMQPGESIMVQVAKDPVGQRGARLTSQLSLSGQYLIYLPGASTTGISRRLPDAERTRLKQILKKVAPAEGGMIARTTADGASEAELEHDVSRLVALWQAIERKAKTTSAPDLLYGEPDLAIRIVRDLFSERFTKLVMASDSDWDLVDRYVRNAAPSLSERLERWAGDTDLFAAYRIDEQLTRALDRKVSLPGGGSLVIDTTAAVTVIDVQMGTSPGQGGSTLEQAVTRTNLEAADEIATQLRLRDIDGVIIIDFIDMSRTGNRDRALRRLIERLARDRATHNVAEVTSIGLVQMTRVRVGYGSRQE